MVRKCANPACSVPFRKLREGRVFVVEVEGHLVSGGSGCSRQPHYFWLCNSCCRTMTVVVEKSLRIKVAPLPVSATAA
jgi:hypothetical protein